MAPSERALISPGDKVSAKFPPDKDEILVGIRPAHSVFAQGAADNGDTVFALERSENQPCGAGNNTFLL